MISREFDAAGMMAGVRDQQSGLYYAGSVGTDTTNRMKYAAHGGVSVMKLGNNLWEHTDFNSRFQSTEIGLGTSSTDSSKLKLTFNYGTTNNNGNLQSVNYLGGGLSYTQTFNYDQLNRLTTSVESGASWSQTNKYDRYGNRAIDLGGGNQSLYFNTSNRITNAGYVYDVAGNLTNDGLQSFGFDAENKIKTVNGVSDVYRYDGDGNRVRKNFATGEKVRMVYNGGQLIAEYDLTNGALKKEYVYGTKGQIATIEPGVGTQYTTADHLGSPRVVTNASAGVVSRHDYMPFGEEVGSGIGGRTTGMGFSISDGVRQRFTSKERDLETGLDYFLARYYSSTQGRFTSPDEFTGGPDELYYFVDDASDNPTFYADLRRPQSLNKYQYAFNNPLRYVDPDGHEPTDEQDPKPVPGQALPIPIAPPVPVPFPILPPFDPSRDPLRPVPSNAIPPQVTEGPTPVPLPDTRPDINKPIIPPDARLRFGPNPDQPIIIAPVAPPSPRAASPRKQRSPYPPGRRKRYNTRRAAEDGARRAGGGRKPVNHPNGNGGPHFHPADKKGKPLNHDHYYYPKRRGKGVIKEQ